jgi:hypothetical protein
VSRTVAVVGAVLIVVLLVTTALLAGILLGRGSSEQTARAPDDTKASTNEATQEPTQEEPTTTTKAPTQEESSASTTEAALSFSGEGDQSTRQFELDEGIRVFGADFEGQPQSTTTTHFGVLLISDDPDFPEVTVQGLRPGIIFNELLEEGETFNGSKAVRVPESGTYVLQVDGEGPWTITIS